MSNADKSKMPNFMKLFWKGQEKYLHATKTGVHYYPMILDIVWGRQQNHLQHMITSVTKLKIKLISFSYQVAED